MRKKPLSFILLAIFIFFSFNAIAAPKPRENFTRQTLKNGLTVMYKVMKGQPMVSLAAVFPIGMNREKEKGIAHLLEHLVFRGGSGYGFQDIAGVTCRQGGEFNGYTTFYATYYNYVIPKENFDTAFRVFNGCVWKTDFSESVIDLERKIVIHELDMNYSDRYLYYPIFHYFFPEFRYSRESVAEISSQDLQDFYQNYYQPGNATFLLAGDFDPKPVLEELEKCSNGYGARQTPKTSVVEFDLPRQDVVETRNLYPYHYQLLMAYELEGISDRERMILKLLSYVFGYDSKIDYEKNEFKVYNVVTRTLGNKDYFGIYYLERNRPFTDEALAATKVSLQKYFREFKKIDFSKELQNMIQLVEMEVVESQESPAEAVDYEVQRLVQFDNITTDSLPVLRKLTLKDLEGVIEKFFTKPPTTWILVKNLETGG